MYSRRWRNAAQTSFEVLRKERYRYAIDKLDKTRYSVEIGADLEQKEREKVENSIE